MNFLNIDHDLYQKLLSGIRHKRKNADTSEFSVPDFFSDNEWSVVPSPMRLMLGKLFKQKVDTNDIGNVVFCYMNEKNWAVYKMVF